MFAYLDGIVAEKGLNELVLDVHGVGYSMTCSATTLAAAPANGEKMKVYTYLSVKEDGVDLFGFATREEKRMFQRLTGVSGIGPKSAVSILGSMPLRDLTLAIVTGDTTALSRAPGVGKKTAQRISLELKETLSKEDIPSMPVGGNVITAADMAEDAVTEAIAALQALGYTASEATGAVAKIKKPGAHADEMIKLALKNMAGM